MIMRQTVHKHMTNNKVMEELGLQKEESNTTFSVSWPILKTRLYFTIECRHYRKMDNNSWTDRYSDILRKMGQNFWTDSVKK